MHSNIDNGSMTINLTGDLRHGRSRETNGDRIETQEKRTRFSLSHDEGILCTKNAFIPEACNLMIDRKIDQARTFYS